jgi:hypothetical protein
VNAYDGDLVFEVDVPTRAPFSFFEYTLPPGRTRMADVPGFLEASRAYMDAFLEAEAAR